MFSAKNNMDQVFDFLMNETERDGMEMDVADNMMMSEGRKNWFYKEGIFHALWSKTPPPHPTLVGCSTVPVSVKQKRTSALLQIQ